MTGEQYWNARGRGFGGEPDGENTTSCAEENLLGYPGTRYFGSSICVHEFSHGIMRGAIYTVDPEYRKAVDDAYAAAKKQRPDVGAGLPRQQLQRVLGDRHRDLRLRQRPRPGDAEGDRSQAVRIGQPGDHGPLSARQRLHRTSAAAPVVRRAEFRALVTIAALCGHAIAAPPQSARSAIVTRITSAIAVDGALAEPEWQTAPKIGDLIQREPDNGNPPSEKTEVTLLHDANNLYIGVMCYDSEPKRVIGTQMARDANLTSDDRISIVLDTYRDQRNAFYFSTNPAGALVDGLVFANGQSNNEWDAIWTVRTRRTDQGWSAEFAIPFKSLSFPSGRTVWGFNISRNIHRKLEEDRWSGARLQTQFFQVSEAGEITNPRASRKASVSMSGPSRQGAGCIPARTETTPSPANRDSTCSTTSLPV